MQITELALALTLAALLATSIAFVMETVRTFLRAARDERRRTLSEGHVLYGSFGTGAADDAGGRRQSRRASR